MKESRQLPLNTFIWVAKGDGNVGWQSTCVCSTREAWGGDESSGLGCLDVVVEVLLRVPAASPVHQQYGIIVGVERFRTHPILMVG